MDAGEIIGIGLGATALLLTLMGRPAPLAPANLRRFGAYVSSTPARWRTARERRRTRKAREQSQLQARREREKRRREFATEIYKLRKMEQSDTTYRKTAWKQQIEACTRVTLSVMKRSRSAIFRDSVSLRPMILSHPSGSLVVTWRGTELRRGPLTIVVEWHPSPQLPFRYFLDEERVTQAETVLRRTLSEKELEAAGWKTSAKDEPDDEGDRYPNPRMRPTASASPASMIPTA